MPKDPRWSVIYRFDFKPLPTQFPALLKVDLGLACSGERCEGEVKFFLDVGRFDPQGKLTVWRDNMIVQPPKCCPKCYKIIQITREVADEVVKLSFEFVADK